MGSPLPVDAMTFGVPLAPLTTFGVGGEAQAFFVATSEASAIAAVQDAARSGTPWLALGGGSNVIVNDRGFGGFVLRVAIEGIQQVRENRSCVWLTAGAGVEWDRFVEHATARGLSGIENMSWIPGTVGAVPVQNVGAYGQDASAVVAQVLAWDAVEERRVTLSSEDCAFGYRRSCFNGSDAGRYVILSVVFRLSREWVPVLTHGALAQLFASPPRRLGRLRSLWEQATGRRGAPSSAREMREVVIAVRRDGRLPDPAILGNAGSFFKAVHLTDAEVMRLVAMAGRGGDGALVGRLEGYLERNRVPGRGIRIPAGAVMQCAGAYGLAQGGARQYEANATILVCELGRTSAADILLLAREIRQRTFGATGVELLIEPRLVGFDAEELAAYLAL